MYTTVPNCFQCRLWKFYKLASLRVESLVSRLEGLGFRLEGARDLGEPCCKGIVDVGFSFWGLRFQDLGLRVIM